MAAVLSIAQGAYAPYLAVMGKAPAPLQADYSGQVAEGLVDVILPEGAPGEIGGFVVCYALDPAVWLLENVAVAPAFQGKGLGRQLIAHAQMKGQMAGCGSIRLYTNAKMAANLAIYPKLGYREVERSNQDGFDRVFFEKQLVKP